MHADSQVFNTCPTYFLILPTVIIFSKHVIVPTHPQIPTTQPIEFWSEQGKLRREGGTPHVSTTSIPRPAGGTSIRPLVLRLPSYSTIPSFRDGHSCLEAHSRNISRSPVHHSHDFHRPMPFCVVASRLPRNGTDSSREGPNLVWVPQIENTSPLSIRLFMGPGTECASRTFGLCWASPARNHHPISHKRPPS